MQDKRCRELRARRGRRAQINIISGWMSPQAGMAASNRVENVAGSINSVESLADEVGPN